MTVRGRLSKIPSDTVTKKEEIIKMYYVDGVKQQEIKKQLSLSSVSVVAEVLRQDMLERINSFKAINLKEIKATDYDKKRIEIIKFLKNDRKMDYSSIAVALNIPREEVFKIVSSETSGLRNTLSQAERDLRNNEMKRLSLEEGLSLKEIGKRVGVSKQMVSRIFKEMGYEPIRGTRKVKMKATAFPELTSLITNDFNAKLSEITEQLREVKSQYASSRQYSNKVILELRCLLVQSLSEHLTLANFKEFQKQSKIVKSIYSQYTNTTTDETRPPLYGMLVDTVQLINNIERRKAFTDLKEIFKGQKCTVEV